MVDERRSLAVRVYLSEGVCPWPRRDADAVLREFPGNGAELLAYAEGVLCEMDSLPTDWPSETYEGAISRVKGEMARRHPELSKPAIDAIGRSFSYDWR